MKAQNQDLVTQSRFNFGIYSRPFRNINPLDAEPYPGRRLPKPIKDWRVKEWQAFQFANDDFFVHLALFNAKVMAIVQVKVFDRRTQQKYVYEKKVSPLAFRAPGDLLNSKMTYTSKKCRVEFHNHLAEDSIRIEVDIKANKHIPGIQASIEGHYQGLDPLVVCIPFGENHGMYSQKGVVPLSGTLQVGSDRTEFGKSNGYLLMDDHRGYYPWEMKWDWITGGKYLDDGTLFGFNLTRNDSNDPENYNENAFWLDGKLFDLPPVTFERGYEGEQERWWIRDANGRVDMYFDVEVPGRVDINAVVIRSKYRGPFGTCYGYVADEKGNQVSVDGIFGMAEDFYLRC